MIIIKNRFKGKDTYIIGKLINNACQYFTIDEMDEVCKKFGVHGNIKNEVRKLYYENGETENWDELAKHENIKVRAAVAKQGYCLDILVNDECWVIRLAVAKQGFGLDKLVNDTDSFVRSEVARQFYGLDILVNDKKAHVRKIARQKKKELKNDKELLREEFSKQGSDLDKLGNDKDEFALKIAQQKNDLNKQIIYYNLLHYFLTIK
jgi:hypothetical protein